MDCKKLVIKYVEECHEDKRECLLIEALVEQLESWKHHSDHIFHKKLKKLHEKFEGFNYNEHLAKHDVEKMEHISHGNMKHKGEVWSITDIEHILNKHGLKIPSQYNIWDMYVAFNAHHDDKCALYFKWFSQNYKDKIIESAIHCYFIDEHDHNKIWHHMKHDM